MLTRPDPIVERISAPDGRAESATTPSAIHGPLAGRRFLMVSLPFGPFGRLFCAALRARGAGVDHLVFNAGDVASRRGPGAIRYTGPIEHWPFRLSSLAGAYSDIVVFGENGPYNDAVLRPLRPLSARVWVLENGYFRPDWVTLERDGVNGSSRLPRDTAAYVDTPSLAPFQAVGRVTPALVAQISLYYLVELLGRPLFPAHRPPFAVQPWRQCLGHIGRYLSHAVTHGHRMRAVRQAMGRGPYVAVCLQREGDSQLTRHSDLTDNRAFLDRVIASFAAHAPRHLRLIVKNHPLDPGVVDMGRITRGLARVHGVERRVDYVDGGLLAELCRGSRGLVVNNSTAALSALGWGVPVKALGRALFDIEGLTDQRPLDAFWHDPVRPDPDLFERFRAHVIARTQINGNFHARPWAGRTAESVADAMVQRGG